MSMSSLAQADELKFPDYTICEPSSIKGKRACFSLAGVKVLFKIDEKRKSLKLRNEKLNEILNKADKVIENQEKQIDLLEDSLDFVSDRRDEWYNKWKKENKARHEAENSPRISEYLGWGAATTFAVTTLVLGTKVAVDEGIF